MVTNCELCAFRNPKSTATALVIRDNKLLLLNRNQDPFKGKWDLPGGYMHEGETPEECIRRELTEELGITVKSLTFVGCFTGTGVYKEHEYPVSDFAYLAGIGGKIVLDEENVAYAWIPIREVGEVAFESNRKMVGFVKAHFAFDLARVRELACQLDPTAELDEQSLYRAIVDGYVAREYDGEKLIGMGWIFPRQTMLRAQAVVEDMIVDEEYRGRGLGKKILTNLVGWAKSRGVEVIELTSNPKRVAANELYKKFGFKLHETNHYLYFIEK